MLDFEKCKEVVEDVWGWYCYNGSWYEGDEKIDQLNYCAFPESWMQSKVNSWEGFGRTVEAMEKRGWEIIPFLDGADHNPALGFYKRDIGHFTVDFLDSLEMRDATHRAALEAVRKEKV